MMIMAAGLDDDDVDDVKDVDDMDDVWRQRVRMGEGGG